MSVKSSGSPLGPLRRVATAVHYGALEYVRTPVLLALLVGLPAYAIGVFAVVAPERPITLRVGEETVRTGLQAAMPSFTAPMVAALVTGVAGLFLADRATGADRRLRLAGYGAFEVVLARLGLLALVAALATTVSVAVSLWAFAPNHAPAFALGIWVAALIYGLVGLLVGHALDRLPGVYVVLFGSMVDLFVFQNPVATDPPAVAALLPGHYPLDFVVRASFGEVALAPLWKSGVVLAVLVVVATAVVAHSTSG